MWARTPLTKGSERLTKEVSAHFKAILNILHTAQTSFNDRVIFNPLVKKAKQNPHKYLAVYLWKLPWNLHSIFMSYWLQISLKTTCNRKKKKRDLIPILQTAEAYSPLPTDMVWNQTTGFFLLIGSGYKATIGGILTSVLSSSPIRHSGSEEDKDQPLRAAS